jgi:hypothetical protein
VAFEAAYGWGWLVELLEELELPPIPRAIIEDCCGLLDAPATPIARLERQIAALARPDPGSRRSWSCPGLAS